MVNHALYTPLTDSYTHDSENGKKKMKKKKLLYKKKFVVIILIDNFLNVIPNDLSLRTRMLSFKNFDGLVLLL